MAPKTLPIPGYFGLQARSYATITSVALIWRNILP